MYKVLVGLIILGALFIQGCDSGTDGKSPKSVEIEVGVTTLTPYEFKFKGHSYVAFDGFTRMNGIVHDPDCPCGKK